MASMTRFSSDLVQKNATGPYRHYLLSFRIPIFVLTYTLAILILHPCISVLECVSNCNQTETHHEQKHKRHVRRYHDELDRAHRRLATPYDAAPLTCNAT